MKKLLSVFLLFMGSIVHLYGQSYSSTIISGINEIAGSGTSVTLTSSASSSTSSSTLPIGFTFNFYGNSYTNFYINPGGTLSFGSANQNYLKADYSPLNIIPSTNLPNNFIGFAFINPYDNYPNPNLYPDYSGANVNYFVSGTAPNRILVVNFKNVVIPGSFPIATRTLNVQTQLSESDGKIEVHNTTNSAPYNPNYGRYDYLQIGIENIDGSNGTAATCPANWNLNNQTVRFTYCSSSPSTPTNVTSSTTLCTTTTPNTQSINLSAACTSGSPVWYPASGAGSCILSSSSVLSSTTVTPTTTTSYKVRCENNGCNSNFVNTTISVGAKIADPTNVTADQFICTAGSSVNLIGSCTNSYPLWYNASNTLLTAYNSYTNYNSLYNASVSVSPSASTTYTIKCENTSFPSCSGSKTVNVGVSNLTNPSSVTSSQTICAGLPLTLQGTCATGTKEWGLWNGNTYAVFTNTNISPTATSYYQIRCVSGTCNTYQNVTITVIVNPTAPTSITSNPTGTINTGSSVTLTANGCSSGNTIKWNDNTTINPKVFTATSTVTYSAKCINSNACESTASSITLTVVCPVVAPTINPVAGNWVYNNSTFKIGTSESMAFTATCASGTTVKWEDNSTASPRTVSPTAATTVYSAKCVSAVCESAASTVTVAVVARPAVPTITGATTICEGSNLTLTSTACAGTNQLYWYKNAETSAFGYVTPLIVTPTVATTYYAKCLDNTSGLYSLSSNVISLTAINPLPDITAIVSNPVEISTLTGGSAVLSTTCTTGSVVWYKNGTTQIGTGNSVTVNPDPANISYSATCSGTLCSKTVTKIFNFKNTVAGGGYYSDGDFYGGKQSPVYYFSYNYGGGSGTSSPAIYSGLPNTPDANTFNFTKTVYRSAQQGTPGGVEISMLVRRDNFWEIQTFFESGLIPGSRDVVMTGVAYRTKSKYNGNVPPCTATWIYLNDKTETQLTVGSFCVSEASCSAITVSASIPLALNTASTLTVAGCATPSTVSWSTGQTGAVITVTPTTNIIYTAHCFGTSCASSFASIGFPMPPVAATNKTIICAGESITLTASPCASPNYITWYAGSGVYQGYGPSFSPTVNTTYYATCGNGSINSLPSNSLSIVVNPPPVISAITTTLVTAATATVSLAGTCSAGSISWYSKNGATETLLGSTSPLSIIIDPNVQKYLAKCTDPATQCAKIVEFNLQNTVLGSIVYNLNTTYNNGVFLASGNVYYDGGSSPFNINVTPDSPDANTIFFNASSSYGGYGGFGGTSYLIVRKSNNWEFWQYNNSNGTVTKTKQYTSKLKFNTLLPPCSAPYVRASDNTEQTITIGTFCDTAGPIQCVSNLPLVSTTDDYATGTTTKQANATTGKITATNKITGTAKVTYQARSIELNAGFKAENGVVFKAEVGGCN